jgi:hypothetical protein
MGVDAHYVGFGPCAFDRMNCDRAKRSGFRLYRTATMLDSQNQGPQCTACGSPMKLVAIEPSDTGKDLRTFNCPRCKRVQRHVIESSVTEAWHAPRK